MQTETSHSLSKS